MAVAVVMAEPVLVMMMVWGLVVEPSLPSWRHWRQPYPRHHLYGDGSELLRLPFTGVSAAVAFARKAGSGRRHAVNGSALRPSHTHWARVHED